MPARALTHAVLKDWKPKGFFAGDRLEGLVKTRNVSPQDRRLATELIFGVIRRQATLDALLKPHVSRPKEKVEAELWMLLRLGTYQLTFLSGMADHAAVHETVELAKSVNARWAGFVNAVLRKVTGLMTDDVLSVPTADGVPLVDGRYRLLTRKIFPDPDDDPLGYFTTAFSFPAWLATRWEERFDTDDLFDLGRHFNTPPTMTLRVNRTKATRDAVLEELKAVKIKAKPSGGHPEAIRLKESTRVEELPGFAEGRVTVQDETAMHAATLLDPQPGQRVLDLCAAPGTKTSHLAELMNDTGTIVAADVSKTRLSRVAENIARLGLTCVETVKIGEDGSGLPAGEFDAVLLDVPCSNTGVLGKRPEARWRLTPHDLTELPPKQTQLLSLALDRVKPGGRVVYSTCSIEPEENEQVVQAALAGRSGVSVVETRLHLPGDPSDGGFQTLLVKAR
ncbi:MAG: 16S rRNA (cytosine(967)-C(5))-methyltransferase RsmB [Planctomycetaceae bacterium]